MLDYNLESRGEKSLYDYLYQQVRDDITSGAIGAGDRLPSKRAFAQHLGVSVVTVEAAYAQLVAEGYVKARPRSGYFAVALQSPGEAKPRLRLPAPKPRKEGPSIAVAVDLAGNEDAGAAALWSRALRRTLAEEPEHEVFLPTPAAGSERLRQALADYLRQSRGMEVDPGRIVVGAGAQVLDNILVQLLGRQAAYAVEDPGYPRLKRLYEANGVRRVVEVPLDGEGVRTDVLSASGADVLHIMPSHQFPTGRVTSISRRYELLGWASAGSSERRRWIIEDDFDCEFRLAGRPVPPLAAIDAEGRVVYTNTFSKGLGSGMRLAYMVLPEELADRYASELGFYSSTVSSVQQMTLARLLESGDYERHVNRMRKRRREERDALTEALGASVAGGRLRFEEADSGLHFVLAVESARGEDELAAGLLARGVRVAPLSSFAALPENATRPDGLRRFVIQYGGLTANQIELVAESFARVLG